MKSYGSDYVRHGCSVSCFCLNCYHSCAVSQGSLCLVLTVSFLWNPESDRRFSYERVRRHDKTFPFSVYPQAFQNWAAIHIFMCGVEASSLREAYHIQSMEHKCLEFVSSSGSSWLYGIQDRNIKLGNEQITVRMTGGKGMGHQWRLGWLPKCPQFYSLKYLDFHCDSFL